MPDLRSRAAVATTLVLSVSIAAFSAMQNLLFPVFSTLQNQLHTTTSGASWVVNAYLLSAAVFTPIVGRFGDIVGKRPMFVMTMLALSAGSMLGALATDIGTMVAARAVSGIGGGTLPLAFSIIRDYRAGDQVTGAISRQASVSAVAGAAGLLIAGPILDTFGFRWLFWLPMAVTLACAVAAQLVLPDSPRLPERRIDVLPAVLLSVALVSLLLGTTEGPAWGWSSGRVTGLGAVAVLAGVWWVHSELHAQSPLIDMTMMRLRPVWTTNLVAFVIGVALYAGAAYIPLFLQTPKVDGFGFSASVTESAVITLPQAAAAFVVCMFVNRFIGAIGARAVAAVGCAVGATAMALFAFAHGTVPEVCLASALLGIGLGLSFSSVVVVIVQSVPSSQTGVASGINANIRTVGGAVGTGVMSTILSASGHGQGHPTEGAFTVGFAVLAAAMAGGVLATLRIPDIRSDPATAQRSVPTPPLAPVPALEAAEALEQPPSVVVRRDATDVPR